MEKIVTIAKALSDPNRIRALMALQKGELCVCHLIEMLGLAPSTVSKHMSILKQAGLVTCRKDSRWVHYSLNPENQYPFAIEVVNLVLKELDDGPAAKADRKRIKEITC